ncbi:exonuclease domain-containing protein [Neorhodopirellula pilleata]|uniref:exonuclease domain-containing protein n=1 Tax=Neorhodopirellula pilleata TaxID=2714738 RepID=UPI0011B52637|nr:exonuclease domain-containing protein [Neorhodopirellula pilleata]
MDFTAIDFETATRASDSACQLAAVRVRGGKIVDSASWLIRPRPFYFSPQNIQIHGITPAKVRGEKEFGELWPTIRQTFGDDCLIAHNASFDLSVLIACLTTHDHPIPEMQYSCTRAIAKRAWPHLPRFGLKPLSDWLGVRFQHHDALEDSIACAKIAIAAAEEANAESLEDLEKHLKLSRGTAGPWGKNGPKFVRSGRASSSATSRLPKPAPEPIVDAMMTREGTDLQRLLIRAEFVRPLTGKRVVFTGTLTRLQREEAEQLVACCGGQCQSTVSRQTSLLVVGRTDARTLDAGRRISTKEEKARQLIAAGAPVEIVSEDDWLASIASL